MLQWICYEYALHYDPSFVNFSKSILFYILLRAKYYVLEISGYGILSYFFLTLFLYLSNFLEVIVEQKEELIVSVCACVCVYTYFVLDNVLNAFHAYVI